MIGVLHVEANGYRETTTLKLIVMYVADRADADDLW